MKALILAAGRGKRLGAQSDEQSKCMLRMFGRPLIDYSFENAARAGVSEIVVVVGYRAEQIINAYGIEYHGVRVQYVLQQDPRGLVHAIETSEDAIGGEDFMLFLADEILWAPRHAEMVRMFESDQLSVICGVVKETDPDEIRKTYALIEDERDQRIYRLIEKPRQSAEPDPRHGQLHLPLAHLRVPAADTHQPEPPGARAAGHDPVRDRRRAPREILRHRRRLREHQHARGHRDRRAGARRALPRRRLQPALSPR